MDSSNILISAIEQLHSEHIVKLLSIKLKFYQKWLQAVIFEEPKHFTLLLWWWRLIWWKKKKFANLRRLK